MAQPRLKVAVPSRVVRGLAAVLRVRFDDLLVDGGHLVEWRQLQFDAVRSFIEARREVLALHDKILEALRADRELYNRMRLESLELALACDALRELIRDIERGLTQFEHTN